LAGAEGRVRAAGLATFSFNLARILGPALAGFAMTLWGPAMAIALNAASFLPLVLFLAGRRADEPVSRPVRESGGKALRFLWTHASTRIPLFILAVAGVFAVNMQTIVPAFARLGLGLNASGFGLLMSAAGAGACVGGLLQWRRPVGSVWRPLAAAGGLSLCLLALSAIRDLLPATLAFIAFGVCSATVFSSASAAVQSSIPDPLRNAATSLQVTILQSTNPLGGALSGWLLEQLGVYGGTAALGAATLAGVVTLALTHRGDLANFRSAPGAEWS
jgi:predicted MFS family arabinose efflux permease